MLSVLDLSINNPPLNITVAGLKLPCRFFSGASSAAPAALLRGTSHLLSDGLLENLVQRLVFASGQYVSKK